MCCWRGGMMLAGPQLVAGPAAPGGERARLLSLYVQDYLECVESLPLDIQRNASLLREMDTQCQEALKEIDDVYEKYKAENDPVQKKRLQQHLQRALINSQELGDEKIQIVTQMLELVENRARQMETHSQCFQDLSENEKPLEKAKMESCQPERSSRRPRRQRTSESRDLCHIANGIDDCDDQPPKEKRSKSAKKKKRSKAKQERDVSPVEFAIDPNEPTYCLCNQVSYGEMIGCDNEQCPIEWFHFSCVGLTYKPKGKWYCPKCRGDNEKTMDKCTDKSKKDRRSRFIKQTSAPWGDLYHTCAFPLCPFVQRVCPDVLFFRCFISNSLNNWILPVPFENQIKNEDGHLTIRDRDKAKVFNAFFAFVFNMDDGPRGTQCPELEDPYWENDQLPVDPETVGSAAPAGILSKLWSLMGFIPESSKSWLT
ncbi:Inhibitor of growth protein 2 [Willisornis vidua]|uniref:Inhibitor of growth protein n=1 Tax=Willisornis vidua TaxID=1566151 RepID=A0ABQ9DPL0_9PASS|nr:Inhibitor of growth protein 2 [Willisornis vidua]